MRDAAVEGARVRMSSLFLQTRFCCRVGRLTRSRSGQVRSSQGKASKASTSRASTSTSTSSQRAWAHIGWVRVGCSGRPSGPGPHTSQAGNGTVLTQVGNLRFLGGSRVGHMWLACLAQCTSGTTVDAPARR